MKTTKSEKEAIVMFMGDEDKESHTFRPIESISPTNKPLTVEELKSDQNFSKQKSIEVSKSQITPGPSDEEIDT